MNNIETINALFKELETRVPHDANISSLITRIRTAVIYTATMPYQNHTDEFLTAMQELVAQKSYYK